jgi:hypothetical protein
MIPCPAGFFCPHKTEKPDIHCHQCDEGATQLERDRFGYVALVILGAFAILYITYKTLKRYDKVDFINRLENFEKRVFMHRQQEFEHRIVDYINGSHKMTGNLSKQKKQEELRKIRQKVQLINRRLAALEEKRSLSGSFQHSSSGSIFRRSFTPKKNQSYISIGEVDSEKEVAKFDARRVFDAFDVESKGEVTFKELNVILGLNELELKEFARRMNELANQPKERETVTRPVFVKYFLHILKETSNLTVSFEEAETLFDEMAAIGRIKLDEIHMSKFYNSSMSNFLSDLQICDLVKVRFDSLFISLRHSKVLKYVSCSVICTEVQRCQEDDESSIIRHSEEYKRDEYRCFPTRKLRSWHERNLEFLFRSI